VGLVPLREGEEVGAGEGAVVVDEGLLAGDAELREEVPELTHVRDRAALVVAEVGEVPAQGFLGLVEELLEAAHHGVARVLLAPRPDELPELAVFVGELVVGVMSRRANEHPAEGVEVEPREELGVLRDELDDRAGLGLAAGVVPRARLLGLGRPGPREVAVEVHRVVGEKVRRRHVRAVEVLDEPLGVHPVVRRRIIERARHEKPREFRAGTNSPPGSSLRITSARPSPSTSLHTQRAAPRCCRSSWGDERT
jgi:hypothetical protein